MYESLMMGTSPKPQVTSLEKGLTMQRQTAAEAAAGGDEWCRVAEPERPTRRVTLSQRVAGALVAIAIALSALFATAPVASAETSGYGRVTMDQFRNLSYEFGIPSWVTRNASSRQVAKDACSAYIGSKIKWFMWWAPVPVCNMIVDQFWKPNNPVAVCGKIPLANVGGTRLWKC